MTWITSRSWHPLVGRMIRQSERKTGKCTDLSVDWDGMWLNLTHCLRGDLFMQWSVLIKWSKYMTVGAFHVGSWKKENRISNYLRSESIF